ncbi:MAG: phosphate ABC transporter permease PstA [Thermoplasmata archaeon]
MRIRFDRDARRHWTDLAVSVAALACVVLALIPLGSILFEATSRGLRAWGPDFFLKNQPAPCSPQISVTCESGGIANALQGTLVLIALSSLLAIPFGILAGIYLSEYGNNRIGGAVRFFTDVMTGIPSIVVGIFVYGLLILTARDIVFSTIAGTVALATIMVPIVARTSEEALRLVPGSIREAALALGIPKHRVTSRVVLSSARSGLVTGALLGVARVGGETAPLLFTAFGNPFGFQGLDHPADALTLRIYYYGISAFQNWQDLAWGSALLLVLLMLGISVASRLALRNRFGGRSVA